MSNQFSGKQKSFIASEFQAKSKLNIYTASYGEIFRKNFVAGAARAFGSLVVYILFITVLSVLISKYLLPELQAMWANLPSVVGQPGTFSPQISTEQIQDVVEQFKK